MAESGQEQPDPRPSWLWPPGVYLEDICFDAQQAVEKSIKAVLIASGVALPYTHDLARLLTLVEQSGRVVPEDVRGAEPLSVYATATRYPGVVGPVTEDNYAAALAAAEATLEWAERSIGGAS